ncbi:MAG: hypothetical protein PHW54_05690 [Candidatus Omnitrophica bacterium]|nr:hypothetical protein [Candidatus Omnitrophota bacterium]
MGRFTSALASKLATETTKAILGNGNKKRNPNQGCMIILFFLLSLFVISISLAFAVIK